MADDDVTLPESDGDSVAVPRGAAIGRFVTLGVLGAGGMGVVLEAHDPELNRKVAIKVLRPRPGASAALPALQHEAQAMARLSHPNVVAIYEVGWIDEQPFIAMELVDGQTLRAWTVASPRAWREVVAMYVTAGRGLCAAHAAGLIHRDFKPENVLVGADGRPRVSDFGLVTTGALATPTTDLRTTATNRGTAQGTPAYMSPEQWAGRELDARSDQFSFCVALWEALHGTRPFAGDGVPSLQAAVSAGQVDEPPAERRVPRWLEAALRRGLAVDLEARWPSLTALLDELERKSRSRRGARLTAVAALGVALAGGAAVVALGDDPADPCPAPAGRLARVWGVTQRAALETVVTGLDPVHGAHRLARATAVFDRHSAAWSKLHVETCRATRVEGRQSDTLLDLRMRCLDRWLHEFDATRSLVAGAGDRKTLDRAIENLSELPSVDRCADDERLTDAAPPPGQRAEADAIRAGLDRIAAEREAGQLKGLVAAARAEVARARALGHPPTLAAALDELHQNHAAIQEWAQARTTLDELVQVAAAAHDDDLAASSWVRLVKVVGDRQEQPDQAQALLPMARAAVTRAGDPPRLRADLLINHAAFLIDVPPDRGRPQLEEARRVLEEAGAREPGSPLTRRLATVAFSLGRVQLTESNPEAAAATFRDLVALYEQSYGPDHPSVANAQVSLAEALADLGRIDDAVAAFREAARVAEARQGESPALATILNQLGTTMIMDEGHSIEDGLAYLERGVRIARATLPADDAKLPALLGNLAMVYDNLERTSEALPLFEEAIGIGQRRGQATINLAIDRYNRADAWRKLGRCADAMPEFQHVVGEYQRLRGERTPYLIYPLVGMADCLVAAGRHDEAMPLLERAIAIELPGEADPSRQDWGRYLRGRIRVETRRDRGRGLAEVRAMRARFVAQDPESKQVRDIDGWLQANRGRAR